MAAATSDNYFKPSNGDFWQQFFTAEYALDQAPVAELMKQITQLPVGWQADDGEIQVLNALRRIMFEIFKFGPNINLNLFQKNFQALFEQFQLNIPRPSDEINQNFTHQEFLTTVQGLLQTLRSVYGNQTGKTPQQHLTKFMQYYLAAALKLERTRVVEVVPAENPFQRYKREDFLRLCAQILGPSLLSSCDFSRLRQLPRQGFTWMREHPGIMVFVCAGILLLSLVLNSGRNTHLVYNYQEHHGSQGNSPESWSELMRQVPADMLFKLFSALEGRFVANSPLIVGLVFLCSLGFLFFILWIYRFFERVMNRQYESLP